MADKSKTLPKNFEALCQAGDLDALKAVFNHCEIDARDTFTRTALHFPDCPDALIRWLVAQGLDIEATTDQPGYTPLLIQAMNGKDLTVLLELGANVNAVSRYRVAPLHVAARYPQTVEMLLNHGADANAASHGGTTPLFWALSCPQSVRMLLDHGADVNAADRNGTTPLLWASLCCPQSTRMLLDHGADANAADRNGTTPLHEAAKYPEIVQLLLDHGARIDALGRWGRTPLASALYYGSDHATVAEVTKSVRLLLDAGATAPADVRRRLRRIRNAIESERRWWRSPNLPDEVVQALQAAQELYRMFGFPYPTA